MTTIAETAAFPRRLVGVLAVTQLVGYGVLFFAFSVLIGPMARDLHAEPAAVTGALTLAILVTAGAAVPIGRWLDRHGGRVLLAGGSLLGVAAIVAWSQVRTVGQLYAVFVLVGLASAATLYEAAFPVVVAATRPSQRDNALLAVTVVGGLASTVFLPLTGLLLDRLGWRTTLLVLAGVLAVVALPGHLVAVPGRQAHRAVKRHSPTDAGAREALRDRGFWLLSGAFVSHAAAVFAVSVLLVGYLRHAGHSTAAAAALSGLLGLFSVTGRLVTTGLARRHGMITIAAAVFVVQAAGAAALPLLGGGVAGAAVCVTAFGLGFGVSTIARPAIVAQRYGTTRYGTLSGIMSFPIILSRATAPLLGATVPPDVFVAGTSAACLIAAALLYLARISS